MMWGLVSLLVSSKLNQVLLVAGVPLKVRVESAATVTVLSPFVTSTASAHIALAVVTLAPSETVIPLNVGVVKVGDVARTKPPPEPFSSLRTVAS